MDVLSNEFSDFALAIFPLIVAHLSIPPYSYFLGEYPPAELRPIFDLWYAILPRNFKSLELLNSFTLFDYQRQEGFHGAMITSLFVHYNYNHLLSNLTGLITTGYRVFLRGGASALYAVFFTGGIVSNFPMTDLHRNMMQYVNNGSIKSANTTNQVSGSLANQLLSLIPDNISKVQDNILSALQKATTVTKCYMGSSGALCALMGFEYTQSIWECVELILSMIKEENNQYNEDRIKRIRRDKMLRILFQSWTIYSYSIAMYTDWIEFQSSSVDLTKKPIIPSIFFTFFGSQGGNPLIDHVSHLQGFGYGALLGLVFNKSIRSLINKI